MKKRIEIVFSSHGTPEDNIKFSNHIDDTIGDIPHGVHVYKNFNEYSLPQVYNKAIDDLSSYKINKETIYVFCHHDILFKTKDWGKRLLKHFNRGKLDTYFDIIGVAGSDYLPENGQWWSKPERMIGIVEHTNGLREWVSQYSQPHFGVKETTMIDGLFMAFDPDTIIHRFDENYKGFHFYDVVWSFKNFLDGCNVGVITDVRILHKSVGMTNEQWNQNRLQFVDEYKDELPYDLRK